MTPLTRLFDYTFALLGLIILSPLLLIIGVMIRRDSPGPSMFAQERVGRREKPFNCLKLRTMKVGTLNAPTHETQSSAITKLGSFLRQTKIDELPQLINVLRGEMSLVGPRPCLPQQSLLRACRRAAGVFDLLPGITGPGQVAGVDMSDPIRLTDLDQSYLLAGSREYGRLILLTLNGHGQKDNVRA